MTPLYKVIKNRIAETVKDPEMGKPVQVSLSGYAYFIIGQELFVESIKEKQELKPNGTPPLHPNFPFQITSIDKVPVKINTNWKGVSFAIFTDIKPKGDDRDGS